MPRFSKEDVPALAFKIYKQDEPLEKEIWELARLCVTINNNVVNGYDIQPLETDNLILMIRPDVNGEIIEPTEDEVREVAEIIYNEGVPKSQLDWFLAEKQLLLEEIENIISQSLHKK